MANYYQASDVLVRPSLADNCPLTVLEAMACGIPVEPKNSEELATALKKLLGNPSEGEEMGKRGREIAHQRFDIREQAKHYLEWYKKLVED